MAEPLRTNKPFGSLTLQPLSHAEFPLLFNEATPLGALEDDLQRVCVESSYVFAADNAGRIIGLVSRMEIQSRLNAANEHERARWAGMPLSSLINATFPLDACSTVDTFAVARPTTPFTGDETSDDPELSGIVTKQDVFVSLKRLMPALHVAMSDPVTGLPNRATFERRLHEEWNRSQRTGSSIAVIVVDLDHFKQTNDRFGHTTGDEMLREVAKRLEESLRSYDIVVRYGGDEFVALCLCCRPGEITIPVQRILDNLSAPSYTRDGLVVPISASVGAAIRHADFAKFEPHDLIAAADQCLYQAKRSRGTAEFVEFGTECYEGAAASRTNDSAVSVEEDTCETAHSD